MLLGKLEAMLHELYALDVGYAVSDFLITDAALARSFDAHGRNVDEKLLIAEADGEADVALYLEDALLERLARRDPLAHLDETNLADFWAALEGVSHFTYYAWNAVRDKHVSLFELELQAEVDKWIACLMTLWREGTRPPADLRARLFERFTLEPGMDAEEQHRYLVANSNAKSYATALEERFVARGRIAELYDELRRFYRLSAGEKLDHIRRVAA